MHTTSLGSPLLPLRNELYRLDPADMKSPGRDGVVRVTIDATATNTTPDPYTVKVDLKAPNGFFLADISEVAILPKNFDPAKTAFDESQP